jgi:hypothetical protein
MMEPITRKQAIDTADKIVADAERDRIEMELFEQMTTLRKRANRYIDGDPDDPR